jgi:hypothetical protein
MLFNRTNRQFHSNQHLGLCVRQSCNRMMPGNYTGTPISERFFCNPNLCFISQLVPVAGRGRTGLQGKENVQMSETALDFDNFGGIAIKKPDLRPRVLLNS